MKRPTQRAPDIGSPKIAQWVAGAYQLMAKLPAVAKKPQNAITLVRS